MRPMNEEDRQFIIATVTEVLAATAPEEMDVYAVTSRDILRHAADRAARPADSDAFFGGLGHSAGEILTHAMALIVVEFLKHGWTLSRSAVAAYLKQRASSVSAPSANAEATILEILESSTPETASNDDPKSPDVAPRAE